MTVQSEPQHIIRARIVQYSHLGMTLAVSVLVGFFVGFWLDGKIGTKPLLAIIGAFIGMTGGFIYLVRTLNRLQKESENGEDAGGGDG